MEQKRTIFHVFLSLTISLTLACQLTSFVNKGDTNSPSAPIQIPEPTEFSTENPSSQISTQAFPAELLTPEDFEYIGAFRLPVDENWDYSGQALTFSPGGDPTGDNDGFPGSLFGSGHDHRLFITEITIPQPVNSKNISDLNMAETIQDFSDLTPGLFSSDVELPRIGIEYLNDQLYYVRGQHFQDFEPSHGWSSLDLSNPKPQGPYLFGQYTNYVTSNYIFSIPDSWSEQFLPDYPLATGRFREGVWGGRGPALFAFSPDPTTIQNKTITQITPLLLYGVQEQSLTDITSTEDQQMVGYLEADHWWDGAWLTTETKSAVVFVGTKAMGSAWYGFSNGVIWDYECANTNSCPDVPDWPYDNRGYWAEGYQAQIIFYSPDDLASVAKGDMETWEPQPYAVYVLDEFFIDPYVHIEEYKIDLTGAMAYDPENHYLYVFERLADEYRSIIHVWKVNE